MAVASVSFGQKIKELFKHSLIYGLTSSLQSLLGFIMLPILTVYYTPDIFGVYSILLLLSALSSAIFYFGASSALGRFYFEEDSDVYKKKIFSTSILVTIGGAILLIVFGFCFSKLLSLKLFNTDKYSLPIILILIGTAFSFLLNLMTLVLRYEKKSGMFFFIVIFGVLINFFTTYILLTKYRYGLLAPIYGFMASNIISFVILFIARLNQLTFDVERSQFKVVIIFGIQTSIAGLLFYILEWVDRLIIKDLLNLTDVGIYSLGYRLGAIMNILVITPFTLIWAPLRMQYANNGTPESDQFSTKVISYYTGVGVIILLFVILFGEDLMRLVFRNKSYGEAARILPIIMVSIFFYGYQNIVDFGIYVQKKVHFYIFISLAAILINVILNYWLIPFFSYVAAAYVTLITYIFTSLTIYFVSNRYYKLIVEKGKILSALFSLVVVYSLVNFFFLKFILIKISICVILSLLFYFFWLDENERKFLKSKVNKKE